MNKSWCHKTSVADPDPDAVGSSLFGSPGSFICKKTPVILILTLYKIVWNTFCQNNFLYTILSVIKPIWVGFESRLEFLKPDPLNQIQIRKNEPDPLHCIKLPNNNAPIIETLIINLVEQYA